VATTTAPAPEDAPAPAPQYPTQAAGGFARAARDSLVVARRQLTRMFRVPEVFLLNLVQPVIFILLFAYVFAGAIQVPDSPGGASAYREFMMAGFFAQSIAFVTVGTASASVAQDMSKGMVDRFRSLPMARGAFLTGRTFADVVQNVCVCTVMIIVALLVGWRVHAGVLNAAAAFGLLMLMGYAFSWAGSTVGMMVRTPEAATSSFILVMFPFTFLSNAFVPPQTLPTVLRHFANWNPFSATVQAVRELFGNPGVPAEAWPMQHAPLASLLWSLVLIAIFRTIAVRKYRKATS
jgi:ABC-2 type transport system permease protein